ncbi:MAG: hypothetical protein N3B17_03610 [Chlorobi bacterium]|nr:hypothetical protein [Chlorobiota bacterium]
MDSPVVFDPDRPVGRSGADAVCCGRDAQEVHSMPSEFERYCAMLLCRWHRLARYWWHVSAIEDVPIRLYRSALLQQGTADPSAAELLLRSVRFSGGYVAAFAAPVQQCPAR